MEPPRLTRIHILPILLGCVRHWTRAAAYPFFGGVRGILTHWYVDPRGLSGRRNDSDVSHRSTPFTNPSEKPILCHCFSRIIASGVSRSKNRRVLLRVLSFSNRSSVKSQLQFVAGFVAPRRGVLDRWRDSTSSQLPIVSKLV